MPTYQYQSVMGSVVKFDRDNDETAISWALGQTLKSGDKVFIVNKEIAKGLAGESVWLPIWTVDTGPFKPDPAPDLEKEDPFQWFKDHKLELGIGIILLIVLILFGIWASMRFGGG